MGIFIFLIYCFSIILSIILLIETFIMFKNIKDIKELLIEQINNHDKIFIKFEDIRATIKKLIIFLLFYPSSPPQ